MENVKEYTVVRLEDDTQEYVVFDPKGVEVVNCGKYGDYHAREAAKMLNSRRPVICWSYWDESFGSAILSELYVKGYSLLTHTTTLYDGQLINTVILKNGFLLIDVKEGR